MTDIEIASTVKLKPITETAKKLGIDPEVIELYGKYKAKIDLSLLKQEAGVDIDHRLRLLGQAGIQQRQLFLRRGVLEKLRDEERLVEGGGGFGQRHRRVVHHQRLVAQHAVVERMPQLVRQRGNVGE